MSLKGNMTARKAIAMQTKGYTEEALALYEKALAEGMDNIKYILAYSVLLLKNGYYEKSKELLVKYQKAPMAAGQKQQLYMNYAVCVYKMGDLDRAIVVLEGQHARNPNGLVYGALGYLYVEAGDFEKARAYNEKALEYDDEDPVFLDNMGQTYYRLGNDKEKALKYFTMAHEIKPNQIDTLYFLAQYDMEKGDTEEAREKLETALSGNISPLNYATAERIQASLDSLQ